MVGMELIHADMASLLGATPAKAHQPPIVFFGGCCYKDSCYNNSYKDTTNKLNVVLKDMQAVLMVELQVTLVGPGLSRLKPKERQVLPSGSTTVLEMFTQLESMKGLGAVIHWEWLEMMDRCPGECWLLALGHEAHTLLFLFSILFLPASHAPASGVAICTELNNFPLGRFTPRTLECGLFGNRVLVDIIG